MCPFFSFSENSHLDSDKALIQFKEAQERVLLLVIGYYFYSKLEMGVNRDEVFKS
jgi:hypothetical protein